MSTVGAADVVTAPPAPTAPPTDFNLFHVYGESGSQGNGEEVEYGLQWAVADLFSGTQFARATGGGEPLSTDVKYFWPPGRTSVDISEFLGLTLDDVFLTWHIRHALGAQYSAWVGPGVLS